VVELHLRASQWYEDNGLEIEAFHHAAAANDVERAERIIQGSRIPLYFRGTIAPILNWLDSLPRAVLDATPSLWVMSASAQLQLDHTLVEQKLQAAEAAIAIRGTAPNDTPRDLIGRVASMRATVAVVDRDAAAIITQSRRALEYLHPDNLYVRTATTWALGYAYQLQGDRAAAKRAYTEVLSISKSIGDSVYTIGATTNLGQVQEADNQLHLAAETYKRVLQMAGDPPQPITCEAYLGLAHIYYEWNDLDAAQEHAEQCLQQLRQIPMDNVDTVASCQVLLARLMFIRGDIAGAAAALDEAEEFVRRNNFTFRMPDVAAARVLILLCQGKLAAAGDLAQTHDLAMSQARVHLAKGDTSAAMALLDPLRHEAEANGWADERLRVMVLQAVVLRAHGETDKALHLLEEVLILAEQPGFIRIFIDEGMPMEALLQEVAKQRTTFNYVHKLLAAFGAPEKAREAEEAQGRTPIAQLLVEPLSERELEVLRLLGTELNGPEVARELIVSLSTMRTHTRSIYNKLGVNSRRAAVRRAEELHLL
jgi:LuxR family maltose regulon positive regulatory protein